MSTFDPAQHPRGNSVTGHAGQFATKEQTPPQVSLNTAEQHLDAAADRLTESQAERGRALIDLTSAELATVTPTIEWVAVRAEDDHSVSVLAYGSNLAGHEIYEHPHYGEIDDIVSKHLGSDENYACEALHADAMSQLQGYGEAPRGWDDTGEARLIPVGGTPDVVRFQRADVAVKQAALDYVDAHASIEADKFLQNHPNTSISICSNDDDELVVTGVNTHPDTPMRPDSWSAAEAFVSSIGFDPTDGAEQDLRYAVDSRRLGTAGNSVWTIQTPHGSLTVYSEDV